MALLPFLFNPIAYIRRKMNRVYVRGVATLKIRDIMVKLCSGNWSLESIRLKCASYEIGYEILCRAHGAPAHVGTFYLYCLFRLVEETDNEFSCLTWSIEPAVVVLLLGEASKRGIISEFNDDPLRPIDVILIGEIMELVLMVKPDLSPSEILDRCPISNAMLIC